jgi:hypothetical protein
MRGAGARTLIPAGHGVAQLRTTGGPGTVPPLPGVAQLPVFSISRLQALPRTEGKSREDISICRPGFSRIG